MPRRGDSSSSAIAILVARVAAIDGFEGMGAKYLPTVKDRKADQRFQRQQNPLHKLNRSAEAQAAHAVKKAKKSEKK